MMLFSSACDSSSSMFVLIVRVGRLFECTAELVTVSRFGVENDDDVRENDARRAEFGGCGVSGT